MRRALTQALALAVIARAGLSGLADSLRRAYTDCGLPLIGDFIPLVHLCRAPWAARSAASAAAIREDQLDRRDIVRLTCSPK